MGRGRIGGAALALVIAVTSGVLITKHVTATSTATTGDAAPVAATGPAHATVGPYHFSTDDFKIDSNKPTAVVMPLFTLHAGTSNGWHTHPGPGFIVVTAGVLTLYQVLDNQCVKSTYGPGQGFVESPGVVHIARNEGTGDLTGVAAFLDVAPGTATFRSTAPAPAACPGIK